MGDFPNKATQFSRENQPPYESRCKPKIHAKTILEKFLSIEKDMVNPLTGLEDKLSIAELMHLKQIANAVQGDISAYKEIIDRLEGKSKASLELGGSVEQTVTKITIKKRGE